MSRHHDLLGKLNSYMWLEKKLECGGDRWGGWLERVFEARSDSGLRA